LDTLKFASKLATIKELIDNNQPALDIAKAAGFKNSTELAKAAGLSHQNTLTNWRKDNPRKYATNVLGAACLTMLESI
jgi:hypothetical protein